jgi:hypothetical protein
MPLAASWAASARPVPEDAPVTMVQGPNRRLSRWVARVLMTLLQRLTGPLRRVAGAIG